VRGGRKLRCERLRDFWSNFVAAASNRGPERGDHVARTRSEFHRHSSQGFYGDTRERAAPTGVNCGHHVLTIVGEEDRHTVCRLHAKTQTWSTGNKRVRFWSIRAGRGCDMDHVRVELTQGNQWHFASVERRRKLLAIRRDAFALVPFREAEVQGGFSVRPARPAEPRAEPVR